MWTFLKRRLLWFLIGFVVVFLGYLFVRYNPDSIILGMFIASAGGAFVSILVYYLERKFPDEPVPTENARR